MSCYRTGQIMNSQYAKQQAPGKTLVRYYHVHVHV